MDRLKRFFKENYKSLIILVIFAFICYTPLPYYIDSPGGLTDLTDRIEIKGKKINGSYNLTYVSEYRATLPILLYSYLKGDCEILKKEDVMGSDETDQDYLKRDYLSYKSSLNNALIAAYKLADKEVNISNNKLYVGYIFEDASTDLKIGDEIVSINDIDVSTRSDVNNLLNKYNDSDKINIKVINNKKEYERYAVLTNQDGNNYIGFMPIEIYNYKVNPNVVIKEEKSEYGGSGGLMLSLMIYDMLNSKDLAAGKKIAGTGTIDINGNVGSIGGIEFKVKAASKAKADIFFVPKDNYKDAIKYKKDNKLNLKIVSVDSLKDAISYLLK